ncbi:hypothetical protein ABZ281_17040 [Streptomyces sp. NPDC006265]|uniref:hypothetical protein n=1 Tax=Streptomyces sp. NPDC006265 TaxID=3156740 RepID=UPI0033AB897D
MEVQQGELAEGEGSTMRSTPAVRIGEMFGGPMAATEGTFALKPIVGPMAKGSLAAAHVYLQRRRPAADQEGAHRMVRLSSAVGRP